MFRALVLEKDGDAAVAHVREMEDSALPAGDVTVAVEYSTLNYKDGLALSPTGGGIVRAWPHVAGIDFAGVVEHSSDPRYFPGDSVVLTGWRVGEARNSSSRVWINLTGLPALRARMAAITEPLSSPDLPPKPPPTSVWITRTCDSGTPSAMA